MSPREHSHTTCIQNVLKDIFHCSLCESYLLLRSSDIASRSGAGLLPILVPVQLRQWRRWLQGRHGPHTRRAGSGPDVPKQPQRSGLLVGAYSISFTTSYSTPSLKFNIRIESKQGTYLLVVRMMRPHHNRYGVERNAKRPSARHEHQETASATNDAVRDGPCWRLEEGCTLHRIQS